MDMLSKHTIRSGVYFMLLFTPDSVTSNYFTTATDYYKNANQHKWFIRCKLSLTVILT